MVINLLFNLKSPADSYWYKTFFLLFVRKQYLMILSYVFHLPLCAVLNPTSYSMIYFENITLAISSPTKQVAELLNIFFIEFSCEIGQAKVTIIIPIRHISESESLVQGGCHDCDGGQFHHKKYMCTAYIFLSGTFGLGIIIVTLACPLCISRLLLSCVLLGTVLYVITLT